jgi:hypothetical protein
MAFIVNKTDFKNTEADQASTNRGLAGAPQPGDPLYQNGSITVAEHVTGEKSSGIVDPYLVDSRKVWLYGNYSNAIAFGAAGLISNTLLETVDRLTGLPTGINPDPQTAPTNFHDSEAPGNSLVLDNNGDFVYAIDDDSGAGRTVYAMTTGGRQNGPIAITV